MIAGQALSFDYSNGHASAIEAAISNIRFARYVVQNGGDLVKALRLYERNTLLSESFYSPLQTVEIVIRNAFKQKKLARFDVFNRLDSIRKFRNRIAHHEPILHLNLPDSFAKIIETIRWICGASADWTEATSIFQERFGTKAPLAAEQVAHMSEANFSRIATAAELLNVSREELARLAVLAAAKDSPAWGSLRLP